MDKIIQRDERHLEFLISEFNNLFEQVIKSTKGTRKAVDTNDHKLAMEMIDLEENINNIKFELHEQVVEYFALFTPMGETLRRVVAMLTILNELEKMSDFARRINKQVIIGTDLTEGSTSTISKMLKYIVSMTETIMQSFNTLDTNIKSDIVIFEDKITSLFKKELDKADERSYHYDHYLIFKKVERLADSLKAIFEQIYYIKRGRFIEM